MTNEEILANAPEGATHADCVGTYYKYLPGAIQWQVWMNPEPESYWRTMPDYNIECATSIRSLSDIRRIIELESELKASATACKMLHKDKEAAERERDEAHEDACFYKSCALSGEVPIEGSQPSAKNEKVPHD